jgi:hypothetical protein
VDVAGLHCRHVRRLVAVEAGVLKMRGLLDYWINGKARPLAGRGDKKPETFSRLPVFELSLIF